MRSLRCFQPSDPCSSYQYILPNDNMSIPFNSRKCHSIRVASESRHIVLDPLDRKSYVFEADVVLRQRSTVGEAVYTRPLGFTVNHSQQNIS